MKNLKKVILLTFSVILVITLSSIFLYNFMHDDTKLNITEKKFLTDNSSKVISINVVNDSNVFGKDGRGVYFDFLKDFEEEHNLNLNIVTITSNDSAGGISLSHGNTIDADAINFYTDHYVLVSKTHKELENINEITGTVGYLKENKDVVLNYITNLGVSTKEYDDVKSISEALKTAEIQYLVAPLKYYEDQILDNLFSISYHFSELKDYYYLNYEDNDKTFSSILSKFFIKWKEEELNKKINENEFDLYKTNLKITEKDLDTLEKKSYTYGFVENNPYDTYSNKKLSGISGIYLKKFEDFSGFKIKKQKYLSYNSLKRAISSGKTDIFYNYYDFQSSYTKIDSNDAASISVVMKDSDKRVITDINVLKNYEVYVKENTLIASYLNNLKINLKTYKTENDLKRIFKDENIVVMDKDNYVFFKNHYNLKGINERFSANIPVFYNLYTNTDTTFNKLLTFYMASIDKKEIEYIGLDDSLTAVKKGSLVYRLIEIALFIILVLVACMYFIYKYSKKLHISTKIKKNDKMKYIDLLTSLKNRNYLNENIKVWNRNTVYPQAIVIVDLNQIRKINDTLGYKEGDKQIQAAANALIKTQLDNSEIMRTDGNEFTVYLVGYDEKHVLSYIKKLNKEFINLPHDYSVSIGFSMIQDDVKLVSDAINEATEKMRENKKINEKQDNWV